MEERKEIFAIQLRKYKRDPANYNLNLLAESTDKFTGAEIEQTVVNALYDTWSSDNKVLTDDSIITAIHNITPMAASGGMSEQIDSIRRWCEESHIKKANGLEKDIISLTRVGRVISYEEEGEQN